MSIFYILSKVGAFCPWVCFVNGRCWKYNSGYLYLFVGASGNIGKPFQSECFSFCIGEKQMYWFYQTEEIGGTEEGRVRNGNG